MIKKTESGAESEQLQDIVEHGARHLEGINGVAVSILAAGWSVFQLLLPQFLLLNSVYVRCIHLAFAMGLVYLCYPALKKGKLKEKIDNSSSSIFKFLTDRHHLSIIDWLVAAIAILSALYMAIDYEGIASRQGQLHTQDIVLGAGLLILLLEAARRALGKALPIIATIFISYTFFSEYMPSILAAKNASLSKVVNQLAISTEGVFGIPLDVSANTVFLFVLFGVLLDKAGGGRYFIELAFSLLGRFKGGPAKAAVLASGLTGLVSGSSIANTVTTGTFTIPLMKKSGYPAVKAGAIEVAASTNGQLMPPIMGAAAFIIAEYCNMTYFDVVRAAFVPAVISYIALIYITHLEACKLNLEGIPKDQLPQFRSLFWKGVHFIIPLGFLLYQLMVLRRSPQLSAYYAILSLVALIFIRNLVAGQRSQAPLSESIGLSLQQVWEGLVAGGRNMMGIGVAVGTAGIIVGIVSLGLGTKITELIGIVSGGNLLVLLLITAVASLVLGMGLPTTANYIVMASLTVPVIVELGGDAGLVIPLIAAHMFCFYFGILADDTPPVALAAYAASAISKADPFKTGVQGFTYDLRTALLPFMFIFNTDLLLIGIHGFFHIAAVFLTGLMAMFAFAAITQNYFVRKNRFYEVIVLILASFVLFRPDLMNAWVYAASKWLWYGIGTTLFFGVYGWQKFTSGSAGGIKPQVEKA